MVNSHETAVTTTRTKTTLLICKNSLTTRPLENDKVPPAANSITIGPGEDGSISNALNQNEFTDWTINDLLILDEYEGDGINNQGTTLTLPTTALIVRAISWPSTSETAVPVATLFASTFKIYARLPKKVT